jgi:hypothetical protein
MPRKKLTAVVLTGQHAYTGMNQVARCEDTPHVRVKIPELEWLHCIDIRTDANTGTIEISVTPAAENATMLPRLRVHKDFNFDLRT